MAQHKEYSVGKLIIGSLVGMGFGLGAFLTAKYYETKETDPDIILQNVKKIFRQTIGEIEGSWIEMQPIHYGGDFDKLVYYGGITCIKDADLVQYEFVANAKTGELIELYRID
ncbi:Predicted small secreted protein [Granulicatella balaenopterae]|uniref:Predicted small secreted protein n=1 Tax=Granulicatella balaenopterae TaxID=137733 RepID=A0A1H9MX58_9LACT|nr:hypothetical protein [Granulicatella balaenopterae]SER28151.1 Predicted small secreted protein [Granulicatella balaenopterae]